MSVSTTKLIVRYINTLPFTFYVYLKFNVSFYVTCHKNITLLILLKYVYNI